MVELNEAQEKDIDELDNEYLSDNENPNVFKVRDALNPPSAMSYSAQELHRYIHEGFIDLNPVYQRDVVWPESKQIGLIDSIFRNFYIPPVIFAVTKDDQDETIRICVDGKQRLTSIQKFLDGLIPHRDIHTKKSFWFVVSDKQKTTRLEIPEPWKRRFLETRITCVEYHNLSPDVEREIFQRVQLGVSLTAAEKLQAISSPWADWIGDLELRHVNVESRGLGSVLEWDTSRGRDFQCIAQLVYCCDGLPEHMLPTAQKLEKWMKRVDNPPTTFMSQINDVLSEFWHIATTPGLNSPFTLVDKRVAPVEFVFIGVILFVLRKYSHEERANAILQMRMRIREQFRDVRNNGLVGKALWNYVDSITGPAGLKVLEMGSPSRAIMSAPASTGAKRKRKGSDDDEEYHPSPIKSLGSKTKTRSSAKK
ncbi:hypothetical protein K503DRAFT_865303 [Rhizopogon vinicolor AM-OR11-026]|uniref:GmrSD restriction endonucleases N-terminal domain-containing protein n=1 Tax=Rhizopogon vinicolor AM-OR11-026 TaxID=1314800 RepID=A0A1B7N423_9AGAM|nr:hypothetical protein K503DRAFT_865303 [Rhizopogon vinicolor AM-OR11-026]